MSIDWRRGLGIPHSASVSMKDVEERCDALREEAETYDDMRKYAMYVAVSALYDAAKKKFEE